MRREAEHKRLGETRRDKDGRAEKWLLLQGAEREGDSRDWRWGILPRNEDSRGED